MKGEKPVIEITDLTIEYPLGDKPALKNINLTIYEGEYVALLGLNGAGKTTLELCLNGVIPNMIMAEKEGTVKIFGMDTEDYPTRELAKTIGMVFDNPEFQISQMSVEGEIALGLENLGVPTDEMRRRITEVLDIVGLQGLEERSPFELSGGQQQRLSIASALAMHPSILVMDEPTSNVDPIGKEEVFAVAANLNKERNMTVILAEHEVEVMAAYADRVVVMHEGEIVLNGSPAEVFRHVDQLNALGLRVPQVTAMSDALHKNGWLRDSVLYPVTLSEAEELLIGKSDSAG